MSPVWTTQTPRFGRSSTWTYWFGRPQFDTAVSTLKGAGYVRNFPEPRPAFDRRFSKGRSFQTPDDCELDLHRTFVMGPYGVTLDLDQLWEPVAGVCTRRSHPPCVGAGGASASCLLPRGARGCAARLVPRRDIAEMLLFGQHELDRLFRWRVAPRAESVVAHGCVLGLGVTSPSPTRSGCRPGHRLPDLERDRKDIDIYLSPQNNYAAKSMAAIRAFPTGGTGRFPAGSHPPATRLH